jgi:type I restriction enzyme S subunit
MPYPFSIRAVLCTKLESRFDAFFHSVYYQEAVIGIRSCVVGAATVGGIALSVVEPTRFKRTKIESEHYGVPFFGTSALFWSDPVPIYLIPKSLGGLEQYIVRRNTLLIPRSGQVSGIIGRTVLPYGNVVGGAVSEDAIRINCQDEVTAGYLFLALSSEYGLRQLKTRAYGSSIPHLDVNNISAVLVPNLNSAAKKKLGVMGLHTAELLDEAIGLERQALDVVEAAIEGAA